MTDNEKNTSGATTYVSLGEHTKVMVERDAALEQLEIGLTPCWGNSRVQFARLLCELVANVEELHFVDVASSMDLDVLEVQELYDRAYEEWEAAKGYATPPGNMGRFKNSSRLQNWRQSVVAETDDARARLRAERAAHGLTSAGLLNAQRDLRVVTAERDELQTEVGHLRVEKDGVIAELDRLRAALAVDEAKRTVTLGNDSRSVQGWETYVHGLEYTNNSQREDIIELRRHHKEMFDRVGAIPADAMGSETSDLVIALQGEVKELTEREGNNLMRIGELELNARQRNAKLTDVLSQRDAARHMAVTVFGLNDKMRIDVGTDLAGVEISVWRCCGGHMEHHNQCEYRSDHSAQGSIQRLQKEVRTLREEKSALAVVGAKVVHRTLGLLSGGHDDATNKSWQLQACTVMSVLTEMGMEEFRKPWKALMGPLTDSKVLKSREALKDVYEEVSRG